MLFNFEHPLRLSVKKRNYLSGVNDLAQGKNNNNNNNGVVRKQLGPVTFRHTPKKLAPTGSDSAVGKKFNFCKRTCQISSERKSELLWIQVYPKFLAAP